MKISLHLKLAFTYIIIILIIISISLGYIQIFSNSYLLSETKRSLGRDAINLAVEMGDNDIISYINTRIMFSKIVDNNYSMIMLDANADYWYGLNIDTIGDRPERFAESLKVFTADSGAHVFKYGSQTYAVYIQESISLRTGSRQCYVVLFTPVNQLTASNELFAMYGASTFLAAVLALSIGIIFSTTLTKNIKKLKLRANYVANRQFDVVVPIKSNDEIEELSQSIDSMAVSLRDYDLGQKVFLQNASHELRTPLMSIRGYIEGIKDGVFDDTEKLNDMILDEVTRLEKLVEDVLYLSKIENTSGVIIKSACKIEDIIDEAIARVQGISLSSGIEIKKSEITDITLEADSDKLATAIINLLSNSLRYAFKQIEITAAAEDKNIHITVSDDGVGINSNELPHIFERFYKGQKGKHGLGLAITKAIVLSHGGNISAQNKPVITDPEDGRVLSSGAVFDIVIPLR